MPPPIDLATPVAGIGANVPPPAVPARPAPERAPATSGLPLPPDSDALLARAVKEANRLSQSAARGVEFSIDEDSGKSVVRIVDTATGQLIRQLPSKEMLAVAHTLDRLQGLLLKQRA